MAAQATPSPSAADVRRLDSTLATLQKGANTYTSSGRIAVCIGLVRLEEQDGLWGVRYPTFQALVEDNRFCAWNVYEAFKLALDVFTLHAIENNGFWASLRLAAIEDDSLSNMISREILRWQVFEGLFTSYQAVDVWLRTKYPAQFPPSEKHSLIDRLRREIVALSRAYIRVAVENRRLKAELAEVRRGH